MLLARLLMGLPRMTRGLLVTMAAAGILAGCSGASPDGAESTEGAATESQLRGAYALELDSHVEMTFASTGEKRTSYDTRLVARVTHSRDDKGDVFRIKPCALKLPPAGGFEATVPDKSFEAVEDFELAATVDGSTLKTERAALLLGVRNLKDPLKSSLPKDAADSHVFDQDKDGQPGFSVQIAGGRVFVGMRVVASLEGEIKKSGDVAGRAAVDVESEIYGDTILFVDAKAQAESAEKGKTVEEKNTFRMAPLSGAATCAAAIAAVGR